MRRLYFLLCAGLCFIASHALAAEHPKVVTSFSVAPTYVSMFKNNVPKLVDGMLMNGS